ncbi:MAG: hypothetical protein VYE64_00115 [Planctomycetota bacterium]|nr:hypothetical protein [Planctomycetota bacterium]
MNYSSAFYRKIIYIAAIGLLLIPLSLVSRPATRDGNNDVKDAGGQLSQLRDEYELSQAKLMEIDPASETMKLASLGLRGVAVNMLWMQAMEHKKKENWDALASTLNALIKIQPNFVKVWEYQAHNMSYNISVEFDDYEYRYHWVKKGIDFLTEGIPYNYRDHRMTDNLGFFTGMKIGRSDERVQFRRMFRGDTEFHEGMDEWIDPDSYFTREYGHDNWKMAYDWYDRSIDLVERESAPQYSGDIMFYMRRPAQLRNQAASLQSEFRTNDVIQEVWNTANKEWLEYGQQQISNTRGTIITMEGLMEKDRRLSRLREELDKLSPGVRDKLLETVREKAELSDEMMAVLKIPVDQRTDEQLLLARRANARIFNADRSLDIQVAAQAQKKDQQEARVLIEQILSTLAEMRATDQYSKTVNYKYWKTRTEVEALDVAAAARAALYDASEMKRRSIFDDEYEIDPVTKEKTILQIGAISKYEKAFADWRKILDEYPRLYDGALADDLIESMQDYNQMLKVTGNEWPVDQPLQTLIDYRIERDETDDKLPSSEEIAERESLKEDGLNDDTATEPSGEATPADSDVDKADVDKADADKADADKADAEEAEAEEAKDGAS